MLLAKLGSRWLAKCKRNAKDLQRNFQSKNFRVVEGVKEQSFKPIPIYFNVEVHLSS
jgi:hypothetical protein